ncbi:MAG: hypothetical protein K2M65_01400 [Muribaculaceae bacterium]|nr:hypothetical protein [Muribaculaceae bacterium]
MNIKHILMIGAVLFTACKEDDTTVVCPEPVPGATEINLMSVNVCGDNTSDTGENGWRARRHGVVKMVQQEKPQILCLQEAYWNQVNFLKQELPEYEFVDQNGDGADASTGYHSVIMYQKDKYDVVRTGCYWQGITPNGACYPWNSDDKVRRVVTWAWLRDVNTYAEFFVFSLQHNQGFTANDYIARKNSAELNVKQIKELTADTITAKPNDEAIVLLAGDMYASYETADNRRACLKPYYEFMISARDQAAETDTDICRNFFGNELAGNDATNNIDHIFVRNAVATSFRTVNDDNYGLKYISNHYPIVTKVKF